MREFLFVPAKVKRWDFAVAIGIRTEGSVNCCCFFKKWARSGPSRATLLLLTPRGWSPEGAVWDVLENVLPNDETHRLRRQWRISAAILFASIIVSLNALAVQRTIATECTS